jgi:hypothetical protein
MENTKPARKRTRKSRAIAGEATTKVTPEMKQLAAEFHRENTASNAAKNKADKARKKLYAGMKAAGVKTFDLVTSIEGKDISLEATVEAKDSTYIDTAILASIVSKEQFEQIVTAAKGTVEKIAGTDVAVRASKTKTGSENVTIKVKK